MIKDSIGGEICRIKNPPEALLDVCKVFVSMLDANSTSTPQWSMCQDFFRNQGGFRDFLARFNPEVQITERVLTIMMPIWKQNAQLQLKLSKVTSKGAAKLLLDFIVSSVE